MPDEFSNEPVSVSTPVIEAVTGVPAETTAANVEDVFRPTGRIGGVATEVWGTVAILESTRGEIEDIDGKRVQHTHDQLVLRALGNICLVLEDIRNQLATRA